MIATPALVVTLWLGWFLGSPLFTNTTVDEAFPFAVYATMPHYIGIEDVEAAMAGMAKVEPPVNEEMPDMVKASPVQSGGAAASPTPENPVAGATTAPGSNETSIQLGPVILKSGEFRDAGSFHKGTGVATIYMGADGTRLLRFEGFKVTNGPDLHVVLSPYGGPDEKGAKCRKADLEKMQTLHDQYGIV